MTVNDEQDALPLEFMDLPELTEETLNATQENTKQVLCVCESRDTGVLRGLWETNEGEIILPESAFASTAQSPEAKSHDTEASAFSSFSTRDALGIVDTGATKTVIGSGFVANLLAALRPDQRFGSRSKGVIVQWFFGLGIKGHLKASMHSLSQSDR